MSGAPTPMFRAEGLERLLSPASIAVVGASEADGGYPARILKNLRKFGYAGEIFPVNPRRDSVFGLPCYPDLAAAPQVPDVALVMVPAAAVEATVADAAALHVGAAVMYSSGFAELGENGVQAQARLSSLASASGLRLLGPNSQGFFHLPSRLVASFSTVLDNGLRPGSGVAYVGQSGALGGAVLGMADARGIGISSWFSTGNEADLTATEIATMLLADPDIETLIIYLEAIPPGDRWLSLMRVLVSSGKQVVCVRSGLTEAGQRAAASHTGAMVRDDAAFTLLARDCGVIVVDDIECALDVVQLLGSGRRPSGSGVGVITTSGGAGGLAADHLVRNGLSVLPLGPDTRRVLGDLVPAFGAVSNPVDVTAQLFAGDQDKFGNVCRVSAADPAVQALVVVITNLAGQEALAVAGSIVKGLAERPEPVVVVWLAPGERITAARQLLQERRIPVVSSFAAAAAALAAMHRSTGESRLPGSGQRLAEKDIDLADLTSDLPPGSATLTETSGAGLLRRLGIAAPRGALARDARQAAELARELRGPLVLKIQSPLITHKTDVGGVRANVAGTDAAAVFSSVVEAVAVAVPDAPVDGVLIQEQAGEGVDMVVGVRGTADGYPAVLTVGAGGVATELFHDIASAVVPVSPHAAQRLVRGLTWARLLDGYRGSPAADVSALVSAIVSVSRAAAELGPRLAEFEINPLRVTPDGVIALDLLVRLTSEDDEQRMDQNDDH